MSLDELWYMLDGKPASARTLIMEAKWIDETFASGDLLTTSEAADILRRSGREVTENPESRQ